MSAHAEIDIAADEREVWTVVAGIASWPTWNPAVREAVFDAELDVGARFRYATPFGRLSCRLTEVDAPHRLAWKGRVLAVGHRQTWQLEARDGGTHVTTDAAMSGLGARLFRGRLKERLQGELDAVVQLLKLEAETRSVEEQEVVKRTAAAERRARAHE